MHDSPAANVTRPPLPFAQVRGPLLGRTGAGPPEQPVWLGPPKYKLPYKSSTASPLRSDGWWMAWREGCGDAEVCGAVVVCVPEYEPHAQSYAVMLRVPDGSDVFLRRLEAEPCSIPWARRSELIHKVEIGLSRRTAELGMAVAGLEVQGQAGFDATGFRTAPTPRSVAKARHLWDQQHHRRRHLGALLSVRHTD